MIDEDFLSFDLNNLELPKKYVELWENINLPIQLKKAEQNNIKNLESFMSKLSKRSYFLCEIARKYNAKNILEIGTAAGWQFFSFAEYCKHNNGSVWSCDISDKRNKNYITEYEDVAKFVLGDSKKLSDFVKSQNKKIDLFYIDGCHAKGSVLKDVYNLKDLQSTEKTPIWIFDDFDKRFGCHDDISTLLNSSKCYYVYSPVHPAVGSPNYQAIIKRRF